MKLIKSGRKYSVESVKSDGRKITIKASSVGRVDVVEYDISKAVWSNLERAKNLLFFCAGVVVFVIVAVSLTATAREMIGGKTAWRSAALLLLYSAVAVAVVVSVKDNFSASVFGVLNVGKDSIIPESSKDKETLERILNSLQKSGENATPLTEESKK